MNSSNTTNPAPSYVFGPVPSRRLGLSLGVDLIPPKTCTFDCLYCQVGRTTDKAIQTRPFVPVDEVVSQVAERLSGCSPDAVTLAGSGEPTLHSQIDQVISGIHGITDTPVALLTNGSLLWDDAVGQRVREVNIVMPTLCSAHEETFRRIHRPHPSLDLETIVTGLRRFRREYRGRLFLEVVLLAGINDTEAEMEDLRALINNISPDKIQLNTVVRPPSDARAKSLDRERLEEIKLFFGETAEIVVDAPLARQALMSDSLAKALVDMVKRRPLRLKDMADSLGQSMDRVQDLVKGLLIKGYIVEKEHSGEMFYLSNEKDAS
ncbi:MAG: radical SAM protein [Deltaproteobacteria bacterium]|nr:radical SAM protein [Deltaproteobacteria bacterium]